MKRDLVKLGEKIQSEVPFHPIIREFEIKGEKYRIRVGWGVGRDHAVMERYADTDVWSRENWSMVPPGRLKSLTKSITEEADLLVKGMDAFIEKECAAEMQEAITDVICQKAETKDRHEILVDAINSRSQKMNDHFKTFPLPSTFNVFSIGRTFDVPNPPAILSDHWNRKRSVVIDNDSFRLAEAVVDTEDAMLVLMVMPQIAKFALKVYTQLAHLAECEKSQ